MTVITRGWHKKHYFKSAAQQSATIFSTSKSTAQNAQLTFLISEAQHNFRYKLFDLVEAHCNPAIAEQHVCIKLKRNLSSAIEISQHNPKTAFFVIYTEKE